MIKYLILLLLLSGCASQTISQDKIDMTQDIQNCIVYRDHIECKMADGNTYYAMRDKIDLVTIWDKSAWK